MVTKPSASTQTELQREFRQFLRSIWSDGMQGGQLASFAADDWKKLAEGGWLDFISALPTDVGSERWSMDVVGVGEEFGRSLIPGPVPIVVGFAAPLLERIGHGARETASEIANGKVVTAEVPMLFGSCPGLTVTDGKLYGDLGWIPFALSAETFLTIARLESGSIQLLEVPFWLPEVSLDAASTMQIGQEMAAVSVHGADLDGCRILSNDAERILSSIEYAGVVYHLLLCCMAVGGSEFLIESASKYARERVQFGVPIGTFQSVRHDVANMRSGTDMARAITKSACRAVYNSSSIEVTKREVAAARLVASRNYTSVAEGTIQIHGGIGFTWEQGIHRWYRAAWYQSLAEGPIGQIATGLANNLKQVANEQFVL